LEKQALIPNPSLCCNFKECMIAGPGPRPCFFRSVLLEAMPDEYLTSDLIP
jgi:hypothetical protein